MTPECGWASADLLGQPDENALGASDVTEPVHVFVLDHFVDELRAVLAEPGQRIVEVVHREHDAEVAEGVYRCVPVIGDRSRREKAAELELAVAVRHAHHGDLDALAAQSGDAPCPVSFDRGSPLEFEAQLDKKRDSGMSDSTTMPTLSIRCSATRPLSRIAKIARPRRVRGIRC